MSELNKHNPITFIEKIDLPPDLFLGLPILSLTGNQEAYICNHRGIAAFSPEEIFVFSEKQQIQIKGRGLSIYSYTKEELVIKGYILSIGFI